MPLALPLVLFVPGVGGQKDDALGARAVQEIVVDENQIPNPEQPTIQLQSTTPSSDLPDPEIADGRQA